MRSHRITLLLCLLVVISLLYYKILQLHSPARNVSGKSFVKHPTVSNIDKNIRNEVAYKDSHLRYNRSSVPKLAYGSHDLLWWNEPKWMKNAKWNTNCDLSLCEYPNCEVTTKKNKLEESSVVIVSVFETGTWNLPRTSRHFYQPWVFYTLECPDTYRRYTARKWGREFNWSMSYHQDADIYTPYGHLEERQPPIKDYSAIFRSKTKEVAWIVSHCHTISKREKFVEKLQKYIKVDIFGGCGSALDNDNFQTTLSQYKFYLGFENAFCRDYITEKYFQYLQYDLIVVVRGAANYRDVLPNRTFINTADFDSIESLGNYLQRLSNDENEYIQYLKEKDRYVVYEREHLYCNGLCTICAKVNRLQGNQKTYDNVTEWLGERMLSSDLH